ncbi:MAG TPA: dihydrofolate reductase family protein [Acidimicrobiales bacterium]|jgi:dihydrofolate reductase|nr:dihydrofolate reductase family protein [Acidimicrobiales bacterium]
MGRIVVTEFVSLDGVMEDPGGAEGFVHAGWTFRFNRGDEGDQFKLEELEGSEAQLLGRVTYEAFAAAWPAMEDPVGFAGNMNAMPKYVVSTTMRDEDATWNNSTVIRGDVVGGIAALKEKLQGDLLVAGSARLVQTLLEHRLVDELRLMVFPIVLGTGKRLFGEVSEPPALVLDSVKTVGEGIVILVYRAGE